MKDYSETYMLGAYTW